MQKNHSVSLNLNKSIRPIGFIIVFVFFLLPIIKLIYLSFSFSKGLLTLNNYITIFSDHETWYVIRNTLIMIIGSLIISIFIGTVMAWIVAYSDIKHKKFINMLILSSFLIPSYIFTLSWTQLTYSNGLISILSKMIIGKSISINLYSMGGIIFIMGLVNYPLVYLLTASVLRRIPRDLEMAARASGADRLTILFKIIIPLSLPGILNGALLAFLASLDNFGVPAFLGIQANITVLSTYIYQQIIGFGPTAFAKGAVLSVILGIIALIGTFFIWLILRNFKQMETVTEDLNPRYHLRNYRKIVETLIWGFLIITIFLPLFSMLITSFLKAYGLDIDFSNLTFNHYRFILSDDKTKNAIVNSFILSIVTTFICLIIGTHVAYSIVRKPSKLIKLLEMVIGLPYALPGIVMALSIILSWMEPLPGWNPGIYGTIKILFIAYITRFMILQVRGSITAILQVDTSVEEAASICGADQLIKWRKILLPLILPGILSGAFLVFITSLTELTVSSLLWSSGSETIGVVIFNFEQGGYTTNSTAFSSFVLLLIVIGSLFLFFIQRFWNRRVILHDGRN
ncbi:iron ABC transporter permease [Thermoanaerobacterium sp. RBIITD]|uniref:ABC transporter permease n=1 Tax=Thermoanaerobacterium sp. RBIITD TaxID=1550240 RepID=UPI000BB6FA53|nr:iron ABC transporter permease [Thermoanaerobacterium sp. RBIITD]SNX54236.1 iron(III) transport system permease protein [Thermoanaerobacterium sp. RBIITD]